MEKEKENILRTEKLWWGVQTAMQVGSALFDHQVVSSPDRDTLYHWSCLEWNRPQVEVIFSNLFHPLPKVVLFE